MPGNKRVMGALSGTRETGKTVQLAQHIELLPSAGQKFVGITLMSHIKYDFICGGGECTMHCNRKFNGTQVGRKMPSGFGDTFDQKRSNLFAESRQLPGRKLLQILWAIDLFQ